MATTIYTYLHNDDLSGSRIVNMDDCMCKLYNIKRDDSSFLKDFNAELNKPALYILINKTTKQDGEYSKREMVLAIVKEYMKQFPKTTLSELKATFRREYLGRYALYEFIQEDIEKAKYWKELKEDHIHYFIQDKDILTSGDGIDFVVCVE